MKVFINFLLICLSICIVNGSIYEEETLDSPYSYFYLLVEKTNYDEYLKKTIDFWERYSIPGYAVSNST